SPPQEEDLLWERHVLPLMENLPTHVRQICHHGFTEMVNNAMDHSGGTTLRIIVQREADGVFMAIEDDGHGIFRKVMDHCGLDSERQSILELAKGKLTTDPSHHSGEGIFFTSRVFDRFGIFAGNLHF